VQRITQRVDTINVSLPVNLSLQNAIGLEFNYSYDVFDWWKVSGNANFFRAITEGIYSDQLYEQDAYAMNTRLNSQMTIKKKVNYQMNWRYRGPQETTQGSREAYTTLDLSWSMDVMKSKATLVANVRDVFNSGKYRYTVEDPTFVLDGEYQRRVRSYTLSFSYRFNQKKSRRGSRDRQNQGGGADEGDFG
jgi:outer membrane receptor for ferrienterochelin and colicin